MGRQLRILRRAAGKTERDVEEANIASRVKLWRIETGKVGIKVGDVRGLCWLYGADVETTEALTALAVTSISSLGFWEDHQDSPTWSSLYLGLESIADEIRAYRHELVPDLLQTPDYFQAVRTALKPDESESDLRDRVKAHQERQDGIFTRESSLRLIVIIGAGVFARPVGGSDVMADQVSRLRELDRLDCIDVRVLPWEAGSHPAMSAGSFSIMDFQDDDDPSVAHIETLTGSRYLEKPGEVGEYRRVFRQLYDKTVSIGAYQV
ncbi:helix-turn-helix domain-containing protein [Virgisporangium ochraceum]|uniref:helix-turn-helix domain-containing protein n=1 Tax=Virgisporangium ochraceum TaxID=65505 RepID=UPI0019441F5B|nr:helix-turn-helix transcriptional regulator [Virgisporangium ochraceum]